MNPNMRKAMTPRLRSYLISLVGDVEMTIGVVASSMLSDE